MHHRTQRMPETLFDLYTERDALPSYYRAVALTVTWLALAGYILFALAFTSTEETLKPPRTAIVGIASTFLVLGYAIGAILSFLSRSLLFAFDAVLVPTLTSSFMGLFVIVANHALRKDVQLSDRALVYVPLIIASVTTVASVVISYFTYRRIYHIKSADAQRRQHVQRWDRSSYVSYGDATSTSELLPMDTMTAITIPEDEAQRRQLLRLLLSRDSAESPGLSITPSTYQITLPGEQPPLDAQTSLVAQRPRSGSLPSGAGRLSVLGKLGRDRSPTVESFKNPRERRRDEIERSSMLITPASETGWGQATAETSSGSHRSGYFGETSPRS